MLKKSDLAKQFELLTQQEIKNYQDSLNSVLQSIRELKEEIKDLKKESQENHAAIHSIQNGMNIEIQYNREEINRLRQKVEGFIFDQRTVNERNAKEMLDVADAIHRKISYDTRINKRLDDVSDNIRLVGNLLDNTRQRLSDTADDLSRRFLNAVARVKQEIIDHPTEASLVKRQLEEKIAAHKVDVAGIMRELTIYKKENMVTEKKIENIYTLIGRLQKTEANK